MSVLRCLPAHITARTYLLDTPVLVLMALCWVGMLKPV